MWVLIQDLQVNKGDKSGISKSNRDPENLIEQDKYRSKPNRQDKYWSLLL